MHILLRIKVIINHTVERTTGNPLLVFERPKVDYEFGERILFNW